MNYLKILELLINFFYYGFFLGVAIVIYIHVFIPGGSFNNLLLEISNTGYKEYAADEKGLNHFTLALNLIRIVLFSVIVIFFKKVVKGFVVGNIFNPTTRNNLKYMGFVTVVLGIFKMFIKVYLPYMLGKGLTIFSLNFTGFGSTYFIIALGLLFIYMSKVLEESALIQIENDLTI